MRVLLLFSSSELGGAERSLSRMVFSCHEIEWILATLSNEGPWCDWVKSKGYTPIIFGYANEGKNLISHSFINLFWYLNKNQFDLIYV